MHPYEIDYATHEFWDALKTRLTPVLGDVEETLGYHWMDAFERCFSRADFLALAAAKKTKGKGFDWFIVDLHQAAERIVGDEDWIIAAESRADAIAYVVERCTDCAVWPNGVKYVPDLDRIEITLDGRMFAVIRKLQRNQYAPSEIQQRARGALHGLRKSKNCNAELTKRVKQWPGLSALVQDDDDGLKNGEFHLPDLSEWLASAKLLGSMAGMQAVTTKQAQTIAALAMGEASWNHLCGHFQPGNSSGSMASLCCPWYISEGELGSHADQFVFYDLLDGFSDFLNRAKSHVKMEDGWSLCPASTIEGLTYYSLLRPESESVNPAHAQFLDGVRRGRIQLTLHPVSPAPESGVWLARVNATIGDGIESCLRNLLQMDQSPAEKHRFRNAEMQQALVAQDAGWLFSVDQGEMSDGRYVRATLIDDSGNKLCTASARLRKAELNWNEGLGAYILSSDYDGKHPVAIIKGISEKTAKLVSSHFERKSSNIRELRSIGIDDQRRLEQLSQRMHPGGAAYG